jgi:hypothetical protein
MLCWVLVLAILCCMFWTLGEANTMEVKVAKVSVIMQTKRRVLEEADDLIVVEEEEVVGVFVQG